MRLTIIYDNEVYSRHQGLRSDWGFACLVESSDHTILFDTGAKGNILLSNMNILGVDIQAITEIVISHDHWDHNGGLDDLLALWSGGTIYTPTSLKNTASSVNSVFSKKPCMIANDIFTTGLLPGDPVDEQSLILHGDQGWYVLAGCSHSGVGAILQKAQNHGEVTGLIGGFHGFNAFSLLKNLSFICPCHCTQHTQQIKTLYPDAYTKGGVGKIIQLH